MTKGGWSDDGRKVKGTLHWVSASHAINGEVRLYNHLFLNQNPDGDGENFINNLNPNSIEIHQNCKFEKKILEAKHNEKFQFLRTGYFCLDKNSSNGNLIFNQSTSLRDSWGKKNK